MNKRQMMAAAGLGLILGACASKDAKKTEAAAVPVVECHGINACKGKGACHGKGHGCAGMNACKGKGWQQMTKEECAAKKGTIKK